MGVLSTQTLRERIHGIDGTSGDIYISPLLDQAQIGHSAVDVRLGRDFIVTRPTRMPSFDARSESAPEQILRYQAREYVEFGDSFVLQPGASALGAVLEYVSLPKDVYAEVLTRSSWGRLALTIATAICVHPGYSGCLTLELVNMGGSAVQLYPGSRIGQLVLYKVDEPDVDARDRGKYVSPTRPEFPKIHLEREELDRLAGLGGMLQG